MTAALSGLDPVYWPCGTCRAESGAQCRTSTGNACKAHTDRYRSVALFERYGRGHDVLWADAMTAATDAL